MVDRLARDQLAGALRHLASGRITNDEFEERMPWAPDDRGVEAVRDAAWMLYSDFRSYRLTGRHRLSAEHRRHVVRWIVFLHSDVEYAWPDPLQGFRRLALSLLSFGRIPKARDRQWRAFGEFDVWPFLRERDFEAERTRPRLLSARSA